MGNAIRYATVIGSIVGVLVLAVLMSSMWRTLTGTSQRLRYWALLCYAVTFTYGGAESLSQHTPFGVRHVFAFLTTVFMLVAVGFTYRDDLNERRRGREDWLPDSRNP